MTDQRRCGACGMVIGSKQACCQPWTYDSELDRCVNRPAAEVEYNRELSLRLRNTGPNGILPPTSR